MKELIRYIYIYKYILVLCGCTIQLTEAGH